MNRNFFNILVGAALLFTQSVQAQIEDFGVQKSQFGSQTADNTAPSSVDNNSLFAFVDVNNH